MTKDEAMRTRYPAVVVDTRTGEKWYPMGLCDTFASRPDDFCLPIQRSPWDKQTLDQRNAKHFELREDDSQ